MRNGLPFASRRRAPPACFEKACRSAFRLIHSEPNDESIAPSPHEWGRVLSPRWQRCQQRFKKRAMLQFKFPRAEPTERLSKQGCFGHGRPRGITNL
jgi:hypothetical protein